MNTGTAATRARVREAWTPVLAASGAQGQQLGGQILAVAHQLARGRLRGPLTDPAREPQDKADLATRLLSGKVDERVVELVCAMVRGRWSKPVDIISALHDLGIEAILVGAHADGSVGDIEQELFAVAEYLDRDRELRQGLEPSRRVTTEERVRLAERVFAAHICAPAMSLLRWCVRHRADGGPRRNLRRVLERAAAVQHRAIANVVTAAPMSVQQEARLRAILIDRLGSDVEINSSVDPSVIGGVRISVRNHLIDSTVRTSLDALRASLVG